MVSYISYSLYFNNYVKKSLYTKTSRINNKKDSEFRYPFFIFKNLYNIIPKDTKFIEIEGGNHAQFGDYGAQKGDNKASISEKEQTYIAAKNTIELLESIN